MICFKWVYWWQNVKNPKNTIIMGWILRKSFQEEMDWATLIKGKEKPWEAIPKERTEWPKTWGLFYKGLFDKKWIKKSENNKSSLLLDTNDWFYPVGNCKLLKTLEQRHYQTNKLLWGKSVGWIEGGRIGWVRPIRRPWQKFQYRKEKG